MDQEKSVNLLTKLMHARLSYLQSHFNSSYYKMTYKHMSPASYLFKQYET